MAEPSRKIDRKKIYLGVVLICGAVFLMLIGQESPSAPYRRLWMVPLAVGLFYYLWGRFFSRGED